MCLKGDNRIEEYLEGYVSFLSVNTGLYCF